MISFGNRNQERSGLKKETKIPHFSIYQLCSKEEEIIFGVYKKMMEAGCIREEKLDITFFLTLITCSLRLIQEILLSLIDYFLLVLLNQKTLIYVKFLTLQKLRKQYEALIILKHQVLMVCL